jgi:hypothetical protein
MSVLTRPALAAIVAASTIAASASSALVAGWTITTAFPTGTGNVPTGNTYSVGVADQGAQTAGSSLSSFHALAAATYTSPAGNGSQFSFSSNNWSIGDYYEARVSTLGFNDPISVSWDQARSSTGPAAFELVFSIDGGANWTFVSNYTVLQSGGGGAPGTWSSTTYNALYTNSMTLTGAENVAELIVRFRSTVAAASSGSSRIDNVSIYSGAIPAPGAIALLGVASLVSGRRRR